MLDPLTERELEVLQLIAEGLTNPQIAEKLFLSVGTVKSHTNHIYSKLDVTSRVQAIKRANELQLLTPQEEDEASQQPTTVTNGISSHNLPMQLTSFVGRHSELDKLLALLEDERVRLVTILGTGGMGKTRLAIEVARQQLEVFRDGAYFVPLATINSHEKLARTIGNHIGIRFQDNGTPQQQLLKYLQKKQILLLLDNFEHILAGSQIVTDILQNAPHIKILVTTRERLRLSNEVVFALGGLAYSAEVENNGSGISDAANLLLQQATLIQPHFEPTPNDYIHVNRICQLTQGMPLAIMLAVGWLEILSLEEITEEIGQNLDLLASEMRDIPPRQRSVRASFDYSWNRLSHEDQAVFAGLSIFHDGFTRLSGHEVAGASLLSLQKFVSLSLLQVYKGRYYVHELLRQYGEEKLQQSGKALPLRDSHSDHYLRQLGTLEEALKGRRQTGAILEIETELANIEQAWFWALSRKQYELIAIALETFYLYFYMVDANKGTKLLGSTYEELSADANIHQMPLYGRVLSRCVLIETRFPCEPTIEEKADFAYQLALSNGDTKEIALSYEALGNCQIFITGQYRKSIASLQDSLEYQTKLEDAYYIARLNHKMSVAYLQIGEFELSLHLVEKARKIAHETGNLFSEGYALGNLGWLTLQAGDYENAKQHILKAIEIGRQLNTNHALLCNEMLSYAEVLLLIGNVEEAEHYVFAGRKIAEEVVVSAVVAYSYSVLSLVRSMQGAYQDALEYARGWQDNEYSEKSNRISFHFALAVACCGAGLDDEAWQNLEALVDTFEEWQSVAIMKWTLPILVILLERQQAYELAVQCLGLAHAHPQSPVGWLKKWALLSETEERLKDQLPSREWEHAWEKGSKADAKAILTHIFSLYDLS